MGLEYLKITPEIMLKISAYDAEAQGRLVMAMIAYALNGEEPEFEGMEKFIWPVLKLDIDRCAASIEKQTANGSKGGRPSKSQAKPNENPNKPNETQKEPSESLNSNTNSNSNSNTNSKEVVVSACAREAASAPAAEEPVVGIDGTDLAGAMADYDRAGDLVARYKMPDTDQSRAALIEDAADRGWEKVETALKDAANGNCRPMISVNFYRTKLKNQGKPRAASGGDVMQRHNYTQNDYNRMLIDLDKEDDGPKGKDGDRMMRHSANARKATYSAAVLDFDEE